MAFFGRDEQTLISLFREGDEDTRKALVQNPSVGPNFMWIFSIGDDYCLNEKEKIDFGSLYDSQPWVVECCFKNWVMDEAYFTKMFAMNGDFNCLRPDWLFEMIHLLMPNGGEKGTYFSDDRNAKNYIRSGAYSILLETIVQFFIDHISKDRPNQSHLYLFDKFLSRTRNVDFFLRDAQHALDRFDLSVLDKGFLESQLYDDVSIDQLYGSIQNSLARRSSQSVINAQRDSDTLGKRAIFYRHASLEHIFELDAYCVLVPAHLPTVDELTFHTDMVEDQEKVEAKNVKEVPASSYDDLMKRLKDRRFQEKRVEIKNALNDIVQNKPDEFIMGLAFNRAWYCSSTLRNWLKRLCEEWDRYNHRFGFDVFLLGQGTAKEVFEINCRWFEDTGEISIEREMLDDMSSELRSKDKKISDLSASIEELKDKLIFMDSNIREQSEDVKHEVDIMKSSVKSIENILIPQIEKIRTAVAEPRDIVTKLFYGIPIIGRILKNVFK